jgi:hypothetical protein
MHQCFKKLKLKRNFQKVEVWVLELEKVQEEVIQTLFHKKKIINFYSFILL